MGEASELERREPGDAEGDAGEQHDDERRQDAAGAALVEAGEQEAPFAQVAREDAGDQEAGDDEKDVDAEVAAGEGGEAGVKEDHRNDGDGAQPVDVTAVAGGMRAELSPRLDRYGHYLVTMVVRAGGCNRPGLRTCRQKLAGGRTAPLRPSSEGQ